MSELVERSEFLLPVRAHPELPASEFRAGDYIPRIELASGKSKVVTELDIAAPRDYVFNREHNLGRVFDSFILAEGVRFRACVFDDTFSSVVEESFDPNDEIYQKCKRLGDPRRNKENAGLYRFGPEVLVYIFRLQKFGTFHFNGYYFRLACGVFQRTQDQAEIDHTIKAFEQIKASHQGTDEELWEKYSKAYTGPLLGRCCTWSSRTEDSNYGTQFVPVIKYLHHELAMKKYGLPPENLVQETLNKFKTPNFREQVEPDENTRPR